MPSLIWNGQQQQGRRQPQLQCTNWGPMQCCRGVPFVLLLALATAVLVVAHNFLLVTTSSHPPEEQQERQSVHFKVSGRPLPLGDLHDLRPQRRQLAPAAGDEAGGGGKLRDDRVAAADQQVISAALVRSSSTSTNTTEHHRTASAQQGQPVDDRKEFVQSAAADVVAVQRVTSPPATPRPLLQSVPLSLTVPSCSEERAKINALLKGGLAKLTKRWEHEQAEQKERRYCTKQCEFMMCCNNGVRDGDSWVIHIKDDRPEPTISSGLQDVTLVTQGTLHRLDAFDMLVQAWKGPKVVVFGIVNTAPACDAAGQLRLLAEKTKGWRNIKVMAHMVNATGLYSRQMQAEQNDECAAVFPINTYRNFVVDAANTNYVFPVDMDFVPSKSLYPTLVGVVLPSLASIQRPAVVVPHFDIFRDCGEAPLHLNQGNVTAATESSVPGSLEGLMAHAAQGLAQPFHTSFKRLWKKLRVQPPPLPPPSCQKILSTWDIGVAATDYPRWMRESLSHLEGFYPINVKLDARSKHYEPFVVVRRFEPGAGTLPRYQEALVGRFFNKVQFVTRLKAHRYKFFTLRREFLAHYPHEPSSSLSFLRNEMLRVFTHEHAEAERELNTADRPEPTTKSPFETLGLTCRE